jgi:hypothetical protein
VSFLGRKPLRKETRPMMTLKQLELNGCDRRKLWMGQQNCSYSKNTNLIDRGKRKKLANNKKYSKTCLQQGTKVILQNNCQSDLTFCPKYQVLKNV